MNLINYGLGKVCKLYHINMNDDYQIEWIDACKLVVPERLDLISKLLYIDYRENHREGKFALDYYRKNLEVCTQGTFNEYGDNRKNTFEDYCRIFDVMIEDIKTSGIDERRSLIPVNGQGVIMDGAHRTAIAAYFGQKIPIIRFGAAGRTLDVDLYKERLAETEDIEFALTEMCKWNNNLYLCCMWPAAEMEKREVAMSVLRSEATVIYRKTIDLSIRGLCNLIPQIYVAHEWVGSISDRFISAAPKIEGCNGKGKLDVIIFRSESLEHVKTLKKKMRDIFGIAENSLHITDYPSETLELCKILLNQNSVSYLNQADPFCFIGLNQRIYNFKQKVINENGSLDNYIVDSSTVMGLYGIREPSDLDYLKVDEPNIKFDDEKINDHVNEIVYHGCSVADLVFDPQHYFYYFGIKILTLEALANFKRNRNSLKDREDIFLINSYIENKYRFRRAFLELVQTFRRKTRNAIYIFLRSLPGNGFEYARQVYHFVKGH